MATASETKKQVSVSPVMQGIGESKVFVDPDAKPAVDWSKLTVNGEAIPEHLHGQIPYYWTDQGFAERNPPGNGPRVSVTREERDNKISARRDFRNDAPVDDQYLAPDPLKELEDKYVGPGMKARFLSGSRVSKEGGSLRGFEIVKNDKGEPVKFGNLVLSQIPESEADKRRQATAERSRQMLAATQKQAKDAGVKEMDGSGTRGQVERLPAGA